jgi:hypothetical protein
LVYAAARQFAVAAGIRPAEEPGVPPLFGRAQLLAAVA